MNTDITLKTRREFLRSTMLGSALTWTVPTFLANTFSSLHADAAASTRAVSRRNQIFSCVLAVVLLHDSFCHLRLIVLRLVLGFRCWLAPN